jgi:hypothetical protein
MGIQITHLWMIRLLLSSAPAPCSSTPRYFRCHNRCHVFLGGAGFQLCHPAISPQSGLHFPGDPERTRELGLRMALRESRSDVLTLVLNRGLILAGTGIVVGVLASVVVGRFMRNLLFGVAPLDLQFFERDCRVDLRLIGCHVRAGFPGGPSGSLRTFRDQ